MSFTPQTVLCLSPAIAQGTVVTSPVAWPTGAVAIMCSGVLNDTDLADATKNMTTTLETSEDGGITWPNSGPKSSWVGGPAPTSGPGAGILAIPNVGTSFGRSGNPPTHVRIRLDLGAGVTVSLGGQVTFS